MQPFKNTVTLRGFLAANAEVPAGSLEDSFAVLTLATAGGTWDLSMNQWTSRPDWHRVICPGPYFCGFVRGMRRGDYLEVKGELRSQDQPRTVVVAGESHVVSKTVYCVHATLIQRLDRPDFLVDLGDDDQ
jgi:hypothetical protein